MDASGLRTRDIQCALAEIETVLEFETDRDHLERMKYRVVLIPSEEGFAVSCPALPGCWSQGVTEEDALESIRDAIRDYLDVQEEILETELRADGTQSLVREVELVTS